MTKIEHNRIKNSPEDKALYFFVNTVLIFTMIIIAYPLIFILSSSFSSPAAVSTGRVVLLPVELSLEGYKAVFSHRHILTGYRNTIFYTVVGTAINVSLTMLCAYPLSRKDFPGRNILYSSAQICFNEHIKYSEYGTDGFIDHITGLSSGLTILPSTDVVIDKNKSRQYLTLVIRTMDDSTVFGMFFAQEDIFELFNAANLPEGLFFYITDMSGNMLFRHKYGDALPVREAKDTDFVYNGEDYSIIRHTMNSLSCEVVVGIPDGYFAEMLMPVSILSKKYILSAILIGILLSAIFSFFQFLPVRKLMQASLAKTYGKETTKANEFHYIKEVMDSASADIRYLHDDIEDKKGALGAVR